MATEEAVQQDIKLDTRRAEAAERLSLDDTELSATASEQLAASALKEYNDSVAEAVLLGGWNTSPRFQQSLQKVITAFENLKQVKPDAQPHMIVAPSHREWAGQVERIFIAGEGKSEGRIYVAVSMDSTEISHSKNKGSYAVTFATRMLSEKGSLTAVLSVEDTHRRMQLESLAEKVCEAFKERTGDATIVGIISDQCESERVSAVISKLEQLGGQHVCQQLCFVHYLNLAAAAALNDMFDVKDAELVVNFLESRRKKLKTDTGPGTCIFFILSVLFFFVLVAASASGLDPTLFACRGQASPCEMGQNQNSGKRGGPKCSDTKFGCVGQ